MRACIAPSLQSDWLELGHVTGKTLGQYVLDYLGQDCFEMICIGPLSVRDVFKEAYNVKYNLV